MVIIKIVYSDYNCLFWLPCAVFLRNFLIHIIILKDCLYLLKTYHQAEILFPVLKP